MTDVALSVCQDLAAYARRNSLEEADRLLAEIMLVLHQTQERPHPIRERA